MLLSQFIAKLIDAEIDHGKKEIVIDTGYEYPFEPDTDDCEISVTEDGKLLIDVSLK